jgi:hypothetical protein
MSKLTAIPVILLLCIVYRPVYGQPPALSDAELDTISAGFDFCPLFGINGPCVASALQMFDPAAPPVSLQTAVPASGTGSVTLTHQSSVASGAYAQSASQSNTATPLYLPNPQVLFERGADLSPTSLLLRTAPGFRP